MPGLKLITAPAAEPVTEAEVTTRTGVDSVASADMVALIKSARTWAEEYCGRAFVTQTWEKRLDAFPDEIELARGPVQSITSIRYTDLDGVLQTLANTEYVLDDYEQNGVVYPAYGKTWPSTRDEPNAVRVQFVAGYGNAAAVPDPIKSAIILIVGQSLRSQPALEASIYPSSVPNAAKEMLNPYRILRF